MRKKHNIYIKVYINSMDQDEKYISPNKITKKYDITSGTLRRWAESGKIRFIRPNGGKRLYYIDDVKSLFEENTKTELNLRDVFKQLKIAVSKEDVTTFKNLAISPFEEKQYEFIVNNIIKK